MDKRWNVSLVTKLLSNRNYVNEVPVEGKRTTMFYRRFGYNELYVAQIIRAGNCITLLTTITPITEDSFWNTNYFEDLTRYVFWTFNKSFLLKLIEKIELLKPSAIKRCLELLKENPAPYGEPLPGYADEELKWCYVKIEHLKKDAKFSQMYLVDEENRTAILQAVEKRMIELQERSSQPGTVEEVLITENETKATLFF